MIGNQEKLEVIEMLIEQCRETYVGVSDNWRKDVTILKAIADDIRAPTKANDTVQLFERAFNNANRRKTALGYEQGSLREIAELTIGRWPTIKQALEKFT